MLNDVRLSDTEPYHLPEPARQFASFAWQGHLTPSEYLWRPDEHMFLKPEVTKEFAARVGHPFAHEYTPELTEATYLNLIDLAKETREKIADLK